MHSVYWQLLVIKPGLLKSGLEKKVFVTSAKCSFCLTQIFIKAWLDLKTINYFKILFAFHVDTHRFLTFENIMQSVSAETSYGRALIEIKVCSTPGRDSIVKETIKSTTYNR